MLEISIDDGKYVNVYDVYDEYPKYLDDDVEFDDVNGFVLNIREKSMLQGLDVEVEINTIEKFEVFKDLMDLEDSELQIVMNYYKGFLYDFSGIDIEGILNSFIGEYNYDYEAGDDYLHEFYLTPNNLTRSTITVLFTDNVLSAISNEFLKHYNYMYYIK